MRALVTGGSGFLGSHVADAATARGLDVRLLDLEPSPFRTDAHEQVIADVRDPAAVADAMVGCDVVLHLAAVADLGTANADPVRAEAVNVDGTRNVLAAARAHGARRVVHASSIYVHARAGGAYRDTKRRAERLVLEARDDGLPATVLRFGSLYGPRADPANAVRRILLQALTEGRIDFWGDGTEVREYVHVHDAADLALDALGDTHEGAVLHLTGRQRVTTRELLDLVAEMVGGVEVTLQDRPFEGRYRLTPYALDDEPVELGRTLVGTTAIDLGPGLLHTLHALRRELATG
jgi:UDP-glucose 4-epimerase